MNTKAEIRLAAIRAGAAVAFHTTPLVLRSPWRNRNAVRARWAFYLIARSVTAKSYRQIGICLRRDHSTVFYSIRSARKLFARDPEFRSRVRAARRWTKYFVKEMHGEI